jgi:hypothetical protein
MIEDKVTLARQRAELVDILAAPLPVEERVRIQGELSIVNAKLKALSTTEAARLKAAADRRKVAGLAEAQANAARARALFVARAMLIGLIKLCGFAISGVIVFYLFVCTHDVARELWRRTVSRPEDKS